MNLAFAIIGLIIVLLINFIYKINRKIPKKSAIIYRKMVSVFGLAEIADICCCLMGKYLNEAGVLTSNEIPWSLIVYQIFIHFFLALLVWVSFLSFQYVCESISCKTIDLTYGFITLILINFLLPVNTKIVGKEILFYGYAVTYAYILCFLVVVMIGFVLHKNKQKVDRKRKEAFLLWTFFWVMNLVFTFALPYCCYSSISSAFGMLIVFIFVENPEIMQGKHKETMLYYYIGECLHFFKDNRPYLNIVGLRLSSPEEVEHFLKAFKKYKDDFFIFEDDTINFYVIFSNKGIYYPILQEYVAKNNLQSILFDEFYVDDTVKLSSFFKENIIKVPKGTIKVVKKEEFFKKEEELQIKEEIENALEENRVIAYVQPIYDVKKKKFTCGECLCRLKMRGGEIMLPYHFIGVAEKYGLICDIETAMFKNMCQILKQKDEIGVEYLEANLSIQKGESNTLYDEYVEIMESFGIDGCHINLEITETDVLDEKNALLKNMDNLKKIGVKFSLDDFGTGESNLGYVIDMPVDIMKFDREIFQKAVAGNRARLVVKNVIDIAHDLGLKVVAEGVELETDVALCEEMNVDYIQGYYFSRPIPVDEFIAFCKQKNFAN